LSGFSNKISEADAEIMSGRSEAGPPSISRTAFSGREFETTIREKMITSRSSGDLPRINGSAALVDPSAEQDVGPITGKRF
jgi:hypothetical protein